MNPAADGAVGLHDQELAQSKHEAGLIASAYLEMVERGVPSEPATALTAAWWCNDR